MFKATKAHTRILTAVALMALPALVSAQGYYDDDIYYNPSKQPKTTEKTSKKSNKENSTYIFVDYPAADTYNYDSKSSRDVDEYNRRGQFMVSDSVETESAMADSYANTRRLQRFHDSDVINMMNDDDYATYVITNPTEVNIYVDSPYYSPWTYNSLMYPYSSWRWSWAYGSPWWNVSFGIYDPWYWGPSWSWGWGPSWSWGPSWAWGPSWGWGPGWGGPAWGPGHVPGGGVAWRPSPTPSGSSRPHAYAGSSNSGNSLRPVASSSANRVTGNGRPGNGGYGNQNYNGNSSDRLSSPAGPNYNGTNNVSTNRGRQYGNQNSGSNQNRVVNSNKNSGTVNSGTVNNSNRNNGSGRGQSTTRSTTNTRQSSGSNSSSGSYNRSSSGGGSHSSGGGFSGGGSRGGGGGATHSGGGGGGRGRR